MRHSFVLVHLHIVFATKRRVQVLDRELRPRLFAYLAGVVRKVGCAGLRVGGYRDHVHLIVGLHSSMTVQELVQRVKICGTRWVKRERPELTTFCWQTGYAAFSISRTRLASQLDYVEQQERLHDLKDLPAEVLDLLAQHGIRDDPGDFSKRLCSPSPGRRTCGSWPGVGMWPPSDAMHRLEAGEQAR